jgi:uncharacterized membrane protein
MIGLFVYLFAVTHRHFQDKVTAGDIAAAGDQLAQIRRIVGINLALGLIVSAVAAFGRLWV